MTGTTLLHDRILYKARFWWHGQATSPATRLRRKVALRLLPQELTTDAERKNRLLQEARAAATIEHPHVGVGAPRVPGRPSPVGSG